MARLDGRISRYAIDNSLPDAGAQYIFAAPDTTGGTFDATQFHFQTSFETAGHGWYEGTGFTTNFTTEFVPTGGTVTAINVDFRGGNRADLVISQISLPLLELYTAGYNYFVNSVFDGDDLVIGSSHGDLLLGYQGNDRIIGNNGADQLFGNSGDDFLAGGRGADSLDGGAGNDRLDSGATGPDVMAGGNDNDVYVLRHGNVTLVEGVGQGIDKVISFVSHTLLDNFENLTLKNQAGAASGIGNDLDNRIIGNASANLLNGLDGLDTLIGGAGTDEINGGTGNDVLRGGGGGDTINGGADDDKIAGQSGADSLHGDEGEDSISGGSGADSLFGDAGADILRGGSESDNLHGGTENDRLFGDSGSDNLFGDAGDDYLNGGTDQDEMRGGAGNDTFVVDDAGDLVVEVLGEGLDTVLSSVSYTLTNNVERLTLTGTAVIGVGNDLNNAIHGTDLANILQGLEGRDRLFSGAGSDGLSGGLGNDYLDGGLDGEADYFYFEVGDGDDVIANYECGIDRIVIEDGTGGALTFGDLTVSAHGSGTLIEYGTSGDSIYIVDVGLLPFGASDFIFT